MSVLSVLVVAARFLFRDGMVISDHVQGSSVVPLCIQESHVGSRFRWANMVRRSGNSGLGQLMEMPAMGEWNEETRPTRWSRPDAKGGQGDQGKGPLPGQQEWTLGQQWSQCGACKNQPRRSDSRADNQLKELQRVDLLTTLVLTTTN